MNRTMIASLRTLLAEPDRPDQNALFAVLNDDHASEALACLAPPGSLAQIAAAMTMRWSWYCDGWDRQTAALVAMITDPRCSVPKQMITTWSRIPSAVGVLHDQTDTLIAWAEQRIDPGWYADLAILLGPSDAAARLLLQYPSSYNIGRTLWRWDIPTDQNDPIAWQTMIDPNLRELLHRGAHPSRRFPAWGWDDAVNPDDVLTDIVNDLFDGWAPDHPSLQGRTGWLERHVGADLNNVGHLAILASLGRSDALAEVVCARIAHDPRRIFSIANNVPWNRLHPLIQTVIAETMQRASDRWERTWACALGQAPVEHDTTIEEEILLWRIDPKRWDDLDPSIRAALVSSIVLPDHCYGWGVHPDLVSGRWWVPAGGGFRFWNPDVPPDDLLAWTYADLLRKQRSHQDARVLIAFLDGLSPDRRMRFEPIIDGRLGGRSEPTVQPPWEWTVWAALPAIDRQRRLRDRLAVLRGDREPSPAVRFWRTRNDGLATVALMVGEVLDLDDPPSLLAALLAQIPALRGDATDVGSSLPFPDDLDAALRAQIERLPIDPNTQAYAAWCLRVLDQDMGLGSTLIALHPTVAVALVPLLNADQQKAVADSPTAQGWESMTFLSWAAACAPAQEQSRHPIQRRIT